MHGRAVGRDTEIDLAWERLARAGDPGPRGVLIEGEPGIGKSVVWGELTARLRGIARVMEARPAEAETGVSYAGLGDLLQDVHATDLEVLPGPQRLALEVAALRREPEQPMQGLRVAGIALAGLWRSMAQQGPLAVAIDDVQWLDAPTLRAMAYALRRVGDVPLRLLLTSRRALAGSLLAPGLADMGDALCHVLLEPLPVEALRRLVAERLDVPLGPDQGLRLHRVSHGNPLLALEVARVVSTTADDDGTWRELTADPAIADLTASRLRSLPRTARRVLASAAALGDPRVEVLARAMGPGVAARAIERANAAGIAHVERGRVRFEHPLLATAAYGALGEDERRALHRTLAPLVDDEEASARHLALGNDRPDAAVAAAVEKGAQRASARGAQYSAAELAREAIRLTPPDDDADRQRRTFATATYVGLTGDLGRVRELLDALLVTIHAGPMRVAVLRAIGETHLQQDSHRRGIEVLEVAADLAADDPGQRAFIDIELTYAYVNQLRMDDAMAHARRALSDAVRLEDAGVQAMALAVNAFAGYLAGEGVDVEAVDRALELEPLMRGAPALFRPSLVGALLLNVAGQTRRAAHLLRALSRDTREQGDEAGLVPALMYQAWNDIAIGDVAMCAQAADEALGVARSVGGQVALATALTATTRLGAVQGDVDRVRSDARMAAEVYEQAGWEAGRIWPIGALGMLTWSLGDARGTIEVLEAPVGRHLHERGVPADIHPFCGDLLEAYVATRRVDDALALIERLGPAPNGRPRPVVGAIGERGRALLLAADGRQEEARAAVETAFGHLSLGDPNPYEEARTYLVKGLVERRARRRADARHSLEHALERFERLGARIWARRTRDEIARLGVPSRGGLTQTERQVALLAAQGLTNREVGAAVFVTPKSVEGILSRAYAKLGIRSRAELGAWATKQTDAGAGDD